MYQSPKPLPYQPEGREILYVSENNPAMARARELCETHTRFCKQPTIAVLVRDGIIIGKGRNGGENPPAICIRVQLGCKTGERYDLCPGCDPKNHAEATAIKSVSTPSPYPLPSREREKAKGADLYLYGHWWCCESCWEVMIKAGIKNVYLVEGATERFSEHAQSAIHHV